MGSSDTIKMVSREKLIVCRIDRLVIDDFVIQYTPFERFDLIAIIYITKKNKNSNFNRHLYQKTPFEIYRCTLENFSELMYGKERKRKKNDQNRIIFRERNETASATGFKLPTEIRDCEKGRWIRKRSSCSLNIFGGEK